VKRRTLTIVAFVLVADIAIAAAAIAWFMIMPGQSFQGTPPPPDAVQTDMAKQMRRHVVAIASTEHNTRTSLRLDDAASYLEAELASYGYQVTRQEYQHANQRVRNLEVSVSNIAPGQKPERVFIVGAHYDSARGAPGANDNGSGTAATLELAHRLKNLVPAPGTELKFVFFTNEEPPYFQRDGMGSRYHAKDLRKRGLHVEAALILETIGWYDDTPGSQQYPLASLKAIYPDAGNFVAVVGTLGSAGLVRETTAAFRKHATIASEGLAAPAFVQGITWSDHSSYVEQGYKAVMITDTAVMRYPYYHTMQDIPDKLDYVKMARVASALIPVITGMVTR
jgi:Zn-dependent M28 family amino/carboxypeptidase